MPTASLSLAVVPVACGPRRPRRAAGPPAGARPRGGRPRRVVVAALAPPELVPALTALPAPELLRAVGRVAAQTDFAARYGCCGAALLAASATLGGGGSRHQVGLVALQAGILASLPCSLIGAFWGMYAEAGLPDEGAAQLGMATVALLYAMVFLDKMRGR